MTTKVPRAHAALRKLHADGWEVERLNPTTNLWESTGDPSWIGHRQYRLRLEPWQQKLVDAAREGKKVVLLPSHNAPCLVAFERYKDETQASLARYNWTGEANYIIEDAAPAMQPTMKLRWLDDTLQQYFEAADGTGEWLEVPTVEGE